jgi:hypothetical protein
MELQPYVDSVRHELNVAAEAGGAEAAALADRLSAPLESAFRLALLEALSEAAEEITRELAPGSVDVRLRGRDPAFIVTPALEEPTAVIPEAASPADLDDGGTWRVTLRLPEGLRTAVDAAARGAGLSVNAWLVRAVSGALGADKRPTHGGAQANSDKNFSGWVR